VWKPRGSVGAVSPRLGPPALRLPANLVDTRYDGGNGPIASRANADVPAHLTCVPRPPDVSPRLVRESGWKMSTAVPCLVAHPLQAAVARAQFGVPDGYVAPHDSPAAYARAVEAAARGRSAAP
jgi:hypothetical protein